MVQKKCGLEVSVYIELAQCYREIGNIAESKRVLFLASQVDQSSDNNVLALLKELEYSKSLYLCYKQTILILVITLITSFFRNIHINNLLNSCSLFFIPSFISYTSF